MTTAAEKALEKTTDEAVQIHKQFAELLRKTNKEHPRSADVQALSKLLDEHRGLELWRRVGGIAQVAEAAALKNAPVTDAMRELWAKRMEALRAEHGYAEASTMERLLIHQVVLCWLRLNLTEMSYSSVMSQSITLTLGVYWEKRLTAAQKRYTRAVETLARVRKLTRATQLQEARLQAARGANTERSVKLVKALTG